MANSTLITVRIDIGKHTTRGADTMRSHQIITKKDIVDPDITKNKFATTIKRIDSIHNN